MTLATITLIVEILFYLTLCAGVAAQLKQKYKWHDRFQAPVVVLNLLFIIFVMIPTFRLVAADIPGGLSNVPTLVATTHAALGTIAQGLAIYMFLAGFKIVPRKIGVLRYWMWTTFVFWTLTVLVGIWVYVLFHTGDAATGAAVAEHDADFAAEETTESTLAETGEPAGEIAAEHAEETVAVESTAEVDEPAAGGEEGVTEHAEETVIEEDPPTPVPTPTPTPAPIQVGVLSISDAEIHGDQVNLEMNGVAPPPEGFVYEVWLGTPEESPFTLGRLTVEGEAINHIFIDPEGRNLLGLYSAMFITEEPDDDADPAPSTTIAFTGVAPPDVIEQVRLAVVSNADTPDGDGLIFNCRAEVSKIELETGFQQEYSIAEDDLAALKIQAEGVINIIDGTAGPNYGDNDGSGDLYDPGDGVGLLGPEGYLQRTLAQIDAVAQAEDATSNTIARVEQARTAVENVVALVERLRELELQILAVNSTAEAADLVTEANNISIALLDAEGGGFTDPTQAGAVAAYTYVQAIGAIDIFSEPAPAKMGPMVDEGADHMDDLIDEHAADVIEVVEPEFSGEAAQAAWQPVTAANEGPGPRYEHAMQYNAAANQVFLFGGRDGSQIYNDVWALDLETLTWRPLAVDSSTAPQARFSTVMIVDETAENLYIATGHTQGGGNFNDIWRLDLTTEIWEELSATAGPAPAARYGNPGGNLGGDLVLTHGFGETRYDDTWRFNTAAGQWENITPAGSLPLKRCLFAATPSNGALVIHGGCAAPFGDCFLDDTWVLDTTANAWREVLSDVKPVGRQYQTLTATDDPNRVVLFGGQDAARAARADLWFLDLVTGAWRPIEAPNGPAARYNHAAVWTPQGMLVYGGRDDGPLADLWLLTIPASTPPETTDQAPAEPPPEPVTEPEDNQVSEHDGN